MSLHNKVWCVILHQTLFFIMAENRDTFISEIYVNNEQAQDAIVELEKKIEKLTDKYGDLTLKNEKLAEKTNNAKAALEATKKSLEGMTKGTEEYAKTSKKIDQQTAAYNELSKKLEISKHKTDDAAKALREANESLKNAREGTRRYGDAINNLSGRSMKSLLHLQRQLKSELDKTKPNTEEWDRLAKKYQDVSKRIKELGKVRCELLSLSYFCSLKDSREKTAGETAKRTLVIFRDCHKRNNIEVPIEDGYEERFYKRFAQRMGWPWTIRKASVEALAQGRKAQPAVYNWRKPSSLTERERQRLGGAFSLELSPLAMEGGAR